MGLSQFEQLEKNYGLPEDTARDFAAYCTAKYGIAPYLLSYDCEIVVAWREWWSVK